MKNSQILNIIAAMIGISLMLYWITRTSGADCFTWFDYTTSFSLLFINMGINIFAAVGN